MARLELSGGARQFYEQALHESDDDGSPHAGKHTSSKPKSSRRKDRAQQKSVSASKPATEAVQQRTGAAADAAEDASESLDEEDEADNQSQDDKDGSAVSSDSERDSDGTATSTSHDESDIASDLEGLPVASVVGTAGPSAKRQKKKAKASPSQVITEAGMASKLGVAFSRVLERSSKQGIMQGSKSVQKRKREEEAEAAQNKVAKQERRERKKRGHVQVPFKGQDPGHDAREKTLVSVATKGVVQLFNAISKAQAAKRQADAAGLKKRDAVKSTKAALLGALKPEAKAADSETPGWKVLQQGFTGMHEASKMKDLDREGSSDGDVGVDQVDDEVDSDEIDGW